jgi:hypothetical protein
LVTIAVSAIFAGCQSQGPAGGPPGAPAGPELGRPSVSDISDLAARPLYTFSEMELDRYLRALRTQEPDLARRIVRLGRQNIGQPYEMYLLGEFPYEFYDADPIYCLRRSDCLTFCEHTYAMALGRDWWSFLRTLQRLRYRDGTIGMLTRNHYTEADWDHNNGFLFEDLTTKLGEGHACVPLREIIKRATFFAHFGLGQDIPDQPLADYYIPKDKVAEILGELRNGDFVNIVRGDPNAQWVGHTGLIALADDGTVDFLHSASPAVREQPLLQYLAHDKRCVGIKILRLHDRAERIMEATLASSPRATDVSEAAVTAALAASPLMSTGAPAAYFEDWPRAMRLQSYRLTYDTPVDAHLQGALEAIDQQVGTKLEIPDADRAFGVLDLTDLRLALVQPDVMFYAASVPKICIVLAYLDTHPEAVAGLDPQIEHELQRVIKRSDNELAAKYSQIVGIETIQKLLQSDRYRFYDPNHGGGLWCGKHYGIEEPRYGDPLHDHSHGATVRQCLRYYLMLEQGKLVSAAASAKLKEIFAAPQLEFLNDNFVRGLNGRDVTILRKSGLWEDWHLDTARVQHGDRVYLLAGMVRHSKGSEYLAEMAAAVDEALCGPQPPKPFAHHLLMQTRDDDFRAGLFEHARPAPDGGGVTLVCTPGEDATYESPVTDPGMLFNEVVASWNVDVPPGAGLCLEIRVGRQSDDIWSPYLYIADWGTAVPDTSKVVTCEQGKVDVDYFHSEQRFDRVQYRVRAACASEGEAELHVRRIAVCVSDTTGLPEAVSRPRTSPAEPPAAAWQRRLPVPFRTQKTEREEMKHKICSPTSISMVLEYRGINLVTEDVAEACFDPTHKIYGNWPRNVQAAYSLGLPGYLARFSDWTDVERLIAAGQPLIISIRVYKEGELRGAPYRSSDGHLIVLTGFDADGKVTVNDPAATTPEKGQLAYLRADLENVWMKTTGGLAYVLLPRE